MRLIYFSAGFIFCLFCSFCYSSFLLKINNQKEYPIEIEQNNTLDENGIQQIDLIQNNKVIARINIDSEYKIKGIDLD